jgi:serine/threonine protein kinase
MDATEQGHLLGGRYRLSSVIGRGGMGAVWQAHDEALNRDVAVKELSWPAYFSEEERQTARHRALREAQIAARLRHVNVVSIYDVVEEDGRPWIVMELLPYRSLGDIVAEDGPLPPAQAAQLGLGILAALGAAHAEGVLHRDVKPANILVGPGGRAVLTDFGIARATDSPALTRSGVVIGSPSYIAPERARGGTAGPAADLWGLGASLYTAVEGRAPFERDDVLASLTAVVADEPDPPRNAGPLRPVISGLLRKDPDQRLGPAQAEVMLRHVATQVSTRAATQASPRRRPRRPRGALVLAAAVALLAATVTSAAVALTRTSGHQAAAPPSAPHPRSSSAQRPGTQPPPTQPTATAHPSPSSASTPAAPPTTASGPPAASSGTGSGGLPPGWYRFTNSTGFSIGVPRGWLISHVGHYVYLTDPANSGIYLLIDQSTTPNPDPLADWEQQQANRAGTYPGYHLIRLESVSYPQAEKAADWEFTYDRNGTVVHVLNRNILANAHHAYALYWSTPQADWAAGYHYFQAFAATFRPSPP